MKEKLVDLGWLPPLEEWDFRPVTAEECRIACHWEYSRQLKAVLPPNVGGRGATSANNLVRNGYCPALYRQAARELFPQAWVTLTKEQRAKIVDSFYVIPALQVRKLGDFLKRMEGGHPQVLRAFGDHSYFMQANFSLHGVEEVIKAFEAWARKEAKDHRQSPRAKAAEPPFDGLKWLAAVRVEAARRKAKLNFEVAQDALKAYRRKHPQLVSGDVFPIYASHGAWSKALADARDLQSSILTDSSKLLAGFS